MDILSHNEQIPSPTEIILKQLEFLFVLTIQMSQTVQCCVCQLHVNIHLWECEEVIMIVRIVPLGLHT